MFVPNTPAGTPSNTEGWARSYAGAGFRVVILQPNSKRPAFARWQSRATADPEEAARQARALPDCNLGLLMAVPARRFFYPVAIDVDPRHGGVESLRDWESRLGELPANAPRALTGGGGFHHLLWVDRPVPSRTLAPGLEVKGIGSQIVVEPSVHPETGRDYVWDPGRPTPLRAETPIPPRWKRALLGPGRGSGDKVARGPVGGPEGRRPAPGAAGEVALLDWAVENFPIDSIGVRNDRQRSLVCSLVCRGYGREVVLAVGGAWLDRFDALGRVGTPRGEAQYFLEACERSARRSLLDGKLRPVVDHAALCREIELADWQKELLRGEPCQSQIKGRTELMGACRTPEERKFVEVWLIQVLHRLLHTESATITATHGQINQILRDRYRATWDARQFERLQAKFITRPGRPASRCELLARTAEGRREAEARIPSEYRIEKLAYLIVPDPDEEADPEGPPPWEHEFDDGESSRLQDD